MYKMERGKYEGRLITNTKTVEARACLVHVKVLPIFGASFTQLKFFARGSQLPLEKRTLSTPKCSLIFLKTLGA